MKKTKVIVALDTATSCGYAIYGNGEILEYGVCNLERHKRGEPVQKEKQLYELLQGIAKDYDITEIIAEDIFKKKVKNVYEAEEAENTFKQLGCFQGVIKLFCQYNGITSEFQKRYTAIRFMFGSTSLSGRGAIKKAMILEVERLGYNLKQFGTHAEDAADAIGILCTYLNKKIKASS